MRFAPSPTGDLHVGNLRTAWLSERLARSLNEPWIVRFEDIDRARVVPGAQARQLADLRRLGLEPDEVVLQSDRLARHFSVFLRAVECGFVYPCECSRREVQADLAGMASAQHFPLPGSYSGRCRDRTFLGDSGPNLGWRLRGDDPSGSGDVIVARGSASSLEEFLPAYHWACAVDDGDGGFRTLVRAWDLESASIPQRAIQSWMGAQPPSVCHASLVVGADGSRLEKRSAGVRLRGLGLGIDDVLRAFEGSRAAEFLLPGGEARRVIRLDELFGVG